ncbi:unnamed protein product, partial [Brachionus calyciflorus]
MDESFFCKYGFPWPILEKTTILEPMTSDDAKYKKSRENFYKIKKRLIQVDKDTKSDQLYEISQCELLSELKLTIEEYLEAFASTIKLTTVFNRRTCRDLRVNGYNADIFVRHRANMDIKFVIDPYGAAACVSAYMLRSNRIMSRILKNVIDETQKGNWSVKDRLLKGASKFMNCSEISAQECAYTLLSMPVSRVSRESVYINTFPSKERNDDELLDEDDNEAHFVNEELANKIENENDEDDSQTSVSSSIEPIFSNDNIEKETNIKRTEGKMIKLCNNDGFVKKRQKSKIIRYKRYNQKKDAQNYFRVEVMFFLPWTNEQKEVECKDIIDKFILNKEIIALNRAKYQSVVVEDFDLALEQIEKDIEDQYKSDVQNEAEMQAYVNDFLITNEHGGEIREMFEKDYGYQCQFQEKTGAVEQFVSEDKKSLKVPDRLNRGQYFNHMCSLNRQQQVYIANLLATLKLDKKFYHFINGRAGSGKSHLIKAIYQTLIRFHVPNDEKWNTNKILAILGAYTGKAAFDIKGSTLHSLFHLTVRTRKNCQVSTEMLNSLR